MSTSFSKCIFTCRFFSCIPQVNLILVHLEVRNKNKDEKEGSKKDDFCKMTVQESSKKTSLKHGLGFFSVCLVTGICEAKGEEEQVNQQIIGISSNANSVSATADTMQGLMG